MARIRPDKYKISLLLREHETSPMFGQYTLGDHWLTVHEPNGHQAVFPREQIVMMSAEPLLEEVTEPESEVPAAGSPEDQHERGFHEHGLGLVSDCKPDPADDATADRFKAMGRAKAMDDAEKELGRVLRGHLSDSARTEIEAIHAWMSQAARTAALAACKARD